MIWLLERPYIQLESIFKRVSRGMFTARFAHLTFKFVYPRAKARAVPSEPTTNMFSLFVLDPTILNDDDNNQVFQLMEGRIANSAENNESRELSNLRIVVD